jgi:hypothetical protein
MQMITLSEYIRCDYATFEALRDATSATLEDFTHQSSFPVSQSFLKTFPPTRAGEPLSGLWDFHDRTGFGRALSPLYHPSNVDVVWHRDRAWVYARNSKVNTSALIALIAHVCRKYLPISISWIFHNHSLSLGSVGGSCVLIDEGGLADGDCTWNTLERWGEKTGQAHCAELPEEDHTKSLSNLIARVRCNAKQGEIGEASTADRGPIVIYVPGNLSPNDLDYQYKSAITAMLKPTGHAYLDRSSAWLQQPGDETGGYAGSELTISTADLKETIKILQKKLPETNFPDGTQLQYLQKGCAYAETYHGGQWSKSARIHQRELGNATIILSKPKHR